MEKIVVAEESGVLPNAENTLEQVLVTEQQVVVMDTNTTGVVVTGIMGPPGEKGANRISEMLDVDKSELVNGATLVYVETTSTWKATNKLDSQILEAGQF